MSLSLLLAPALLAAGSPKSAPSHQRVASFDELRFVGMVRQGAEPSCGTGSIATILAVQFHVVVDEAGLWLSYLATLDELSREKVMGEGLSLRAMITILAGEGFAGTPMQIGIDDLRTTGRPAILYIERGKPAPFRHFVVLAGIEGSSAVILDPATGRRRMPVQELKRYWTGVAVMVEKVSAVPPVR